MANTTLDNPKLIRTIEQRMIRNDEHELRCLLAWRKREHPAWSQYASEAKVAA